MPIMAFGSKFTERIAAMMVAIFAAA